jgi:hypothetical protein
MLTRSLPSDYWTKIVEKREFLDALLREGLNPTWIFKAIQHRTYPPHECHEVFFEVPLIEQLKHTDPEKAKSIDYAIRNLSTLLSNPIITGEDEKAISCCKERIIKEYGLDHPSYKELLNSFRSETERNNVEDYADYPEASVGCEIDARLRTEEQCEGKLFDKLLRYIEKFANSINEKMPFGHQSDYTQRDIFELVAEILNLRAPDRCEYNAEKIRTSYGNFLKAKV